MESAPLIVTAALGAADQKYFDALRRAHFPPERNYLNAHLTLFHHLPSARADELLRLLKVLAAESPPPAATQIEVYSLGRGVAFRIDAPALMDLRDRIAEWFSADLTPQDSGRPRLHITVQNKVEPSVAKALLAQLQQDFRPRGLAVTGISVHHYRGGPWEPLAHIGFRGKPRGRY